MLRLRISILTVLLLDTIMHPQKGMLPTRPRRRAAFAAALGVLALAGSALLPTAAEAQAQRPVLVDLIDAPDSECPGAAPRVARGARIPPFCIAGTVHHPSGVERVLFNGEAVTTRPGTMAGTVHFNRWMLPKAETEPVTVAATASDGTSTDQRFDVETQMLSGNEFAFRIRALETRVLGGGPAAPPPVAAAQPQAAPEARAETPPAVVAAAETAPTAPPAEAAAQPVAQAAAAQPVAAAPAPAQTAAAPAPDAAATSAAPAAPLPAGAPEPMPAPDGAEPVAPDAVVVAEAAEPALAPAAPAAIAESTTHYVHILEPAEWTGVSTRGVQVRPRNSVRVRGTAQHAAGVASIEVDGRRASVSIDGSGAATFMAYVVPDASREHVEVTVRGNSGPPIVKHYPVVAPPAAAVAVSGPAAGAEPALQLRGNRWAVIVGVSAYEDGAIPSLRFADRDAQAFYDFLVSERAGAGGFDPENVRLLLNEDASYRNIRSALFTFLKNATPDDQVIIYFAGHGAPDPQRLQNLYLLTADTDLADIAGTAFPMDDVNRAVQALYARDVLVITDACHSAGVGGQVATRDISVNQINTAFLQQLNSSSGGIAIFTASGANQLSQEGEQWGGGHGVFTYHLLEALNGAADEDGDQIVTLTEAMEYTRARVRSATQNAQIPTISQTSFDPYLPMAIVLEPGMVPQTQVAVRASRPAAGPAAPAGPSAAAATPARTRAAADRALEQNREAVRLFPNNVQYRRNLAQALLDAGQPAEGIAELRELVNRATTAEHRHLLGQALFHADSLDAALEQFQQATREDGRAADYTHSLGLAQMRLGQPDQAVNSIRRATRISSLNAVYRKDLGHALLQAGNPSAAATELREAVRLEESLVQAHVLLAQAMIRQGPTHAFDAIEAMNTAVRLDPTNVEVHLELGRLNLTMGNQQGAIEAIRQAVALQPRNPALRSELGNALEQAGMPFEMLIERREAARLEPTGAAYRYDLGAALLRARQHEEAIAELREAIALMPDYADYHNTLGTALRDAGQEEEAAAAFRAAIERDENIARYHYNLAMLLAKSSPSAALPHMETAHKLAPAETEYRNAVRDLRRQAARSR